MITVHHLERSRSQRILWLLEELALPYRVARYDRAESMGAPEALYRVHPLGKSPVIDDDGVVVAESGAITEYLVGKADGRLGAPADPEAARRYLYYMHYAEASVMAALVTMLMFGRFAPEAAASLKAGVDAHLDFIESELAGRRWFAGEDFTAADTMMSFPLELAAARAGATEGRPAIGAWLAAIHARPAYRAALETGGPYAYA